MSKNTLTTAQAKANTEIWRFVQENREPRTGAGHQFGIDTRGRAIVPLVGLLVGHDLTWIGGGADIDDQCISFCVWNVKTGLMVTIGHPTPEAAFDAAIARIQASASDHRPNLHSTLPTPAPVHMASKSEDARSLAKAHSAALKAFGPECRLPNASQGEHLDDVKPAAEGAPLPPLRQPAKRARVYVCHPYSNDPAGNAARVATICRGIVAEGLLPIAPQVYLGAFVDDATERETAMILCLDLLFWCDEVRVYGPTLTAGMLDELRFAMSQGMRIVHVAGDDHP